MYLKLFFIAKGNIQKLHKNAALCVNIKITTI